MPIAPGTICLTWVPFRKPISTPAGSTAITIDQLATHTAGFPERSRYGELEAEPGTRWSYSNCGTNWLANVLPDRFGQDLRELTWNRLFGPMGLSDADVQWRTPAMFFTEPAHGLPATEFNGGMLANVDAMARLGLLFLHSGDWDGRQIPLALLCRAGDSAGLPAPAI